MGNRWSTFRRHDSEPAPGLDLSRVLVIGFLVAAVLGAAIGLGWMSYQLLRSQFGG